VTPPEPLDPDDPKGLVRESYRIEGISAAECRSILVDWALSLPLGADHPGAATRLLASRGVPGHPMSALLAEVGTAGGTGQRRGGRAGRFARGA